MKMYVIMNNYQIGSYAMRCLSNKVISTERIDRYHTKVVYDLDFSDLQLLGRAVGNINRIKKCEE